MIVLRRELLVLGTVLLFIGVVATSIAVGIQEENVLCSDRLDHKIAYDLKNMTSWSVYGNFSEGRRLRVVIQPGRDWIAEPAAGYNYLNLPVNISDPNGKDTEFIVEFTQDPYAEHNLQPSSVEVISNGGGLTFEKSNELETINGTVYYEELAGITNYRGVYNVTVGRTFGVFGPPEILDLYSLEVETVYPYWFVIVAGVASMVAGVFLLVWVWKNPKNKKKLKTDAR